MVSQVEIFCNAEEGVVKRCAFLSTPSIYFSLKDKNVKAVGKCLEFDESFAKKAPDNVVFYDFNKPEDLP